MEDKITKIFKRHIAKILNLLDLFNLKEELKREIKKEMWFLHDDILEKNKLKENYNEQEQDYNR